MAALILAGCGGSGQSNPQAWQTVSGNGFRFQAPKTWQVAGGAVGRKASDGGDFVQVATFPLARRYTPALFGRVQTELATRMAQVAKQAGGVVQGHRVITVDGARAHAYEVSSGGRTSRYTFVLRGKREFLLLCSAGAAVCDELAASFVAD